MIEPSGTLRDRIGELAQAAQDAAVADWSGPPGDRTPMRVFVERALQAYAAELTLPDRQDIVLARQAHDLQAERDQLATLIHWALGAGDSDFPGLPADWPRRKFYWRQELRRQFEAIPHTPATVVGVAPY